MSQEQGGSRERAWAHFVAQEDHSAVFLTGLGIACLTALALYAIGGVGTLTQRASSNGGDELPDRSVPGTPPGHGSHPGGPPDRPVSGFGPYQVLRSRPGGGTGYFIRILVALLILFLVV